MVSIMKYFNFNYYKNKILEVINTHSQNCLRHYFMLVRGYSFFNKL